MKSIPGTDGSWDGWCIGCKKESHTSTPWMEMREASHLKVRELQYPIILCQSTVPDFPGRKSVVVVLCGEGVEDEELEGSHLASGYCVPR